VEEVTRAAARGAASGLDPDVGLGADATFARRCLTASSAAAARGDAFARAASAALSGDGAEGSPETPSVNADARRARFEARLESALAFYAAAEAAAPRGSPEAAAAATRAARALVSEHPGFDGGHLAGEDEEEDEADAKTNGEDGDKKTQKKRKASRVSGTTPSRSARASRACASLSPPRGARRRRAGSTRRRIWRWRTCWPRRATPRLPSTSTPRRCTTCRTTARPPPRRRRAPARRRRRRRTGWRGSATP
jgi:hypothetical protein